MMMVRISKALPCSSPEELHPIRLAAPGCSRLFACLACFTQQIVDELQTGSDDVNILLDRLIAGYQSSIENKGKYSVCNNQHIERDSRHVVGSTVCPQSLPCCCL